MNPQSWIGLTIVSRSCALDKHFQDIDFGDSLEVVEYLDSEGVFRLRNISNGAESIYVTEEDLQILAGSAPK